MELQARYDLCHALIQEAGALAQGYFNNLSALKIKFLCRWFDSAPGHQETPKPPSGGFCHFRLISKNLLGSSKCY